MSSELISGGVEVLRMRSINVMKMLLPADDPKISTSVRPASFEVVARRPHFVILSYAVHVPLYNSVEHCLNSILLLPAVFNGLNCKRRRGENYGCGTAIQSRDFERAMNPERQKIYEEPN